MEQTTNYGLKKFGYDDGADIVAISDNMDRIDTVLGAKANGNGAVWYATEVVQNTEFPHGIDITIPNFVFTEGCTIIIKLPALDKSALQATANWNLRIPDLVGIKDFRLLSAGNQTKDALISRDMLYGNQIISVVLSSELKDPFNGSFGTAFLDAFPASRNFYSLAQLNFKDSDFTLDTAQSALLKVINALPYYGVLSCYLRGLGEPIPEDAFPIFWGLINSRIISDTGYPTTEWWLRVERGAWSNTPHKITVLNNSSSGNLTMEFFAYYDNTLGTFKPANVGSNKNLLHNWDFRNPVNQRGENSYVLTSLSYFFDCWRVSGSPTSANPITISKGDYFTTISTNGTVGIVNQVEQYKNFSKKTVTASVLMEVVSGDAYLAINDGTYTAVKCDSIGELKLYTLTKTISSTPSRLAILLDGFNAGMHVKVYAMKLELGTVSTLLNDPPADYGEQLALCQRYQVSLMGTDNWYRVSATFVTTDWLDFYVPLTTTLRTKPTLMPNAWTIKTLAGVVQTGFTVQNIYFVSTGITIRFQKTAHGMSNAVCEFNNLDRVVFDANL